MKSQLMLSLLMMVVAGCASNQDKIVFISEAEVRSVAAKSVASATGVTSLAKADQLQIEQLAFSYLLERRFWDLAEYSAVFLQAEDAQVELLLQKFPAHTPPIKPGSHADLRSKKMPRDKDTGRPAMILSVDVNEPGADGSVAAQGRWFGGGAVSGFYPFVFRKNGGNWELQPEK